MKKKIFSALTAVSFFVSLCSCDSSDVIDYFFETSSDAGYETVSVDDVNACVEKLIEDIKIHDNEAAVRDDIDKLLETADIAYDAVMYSQLDRSCEWYDDKLEERYDTASETQYIVECALDYAFSKGSASDEYSSLFDELIDSETSEYFNQKGMSLARCEGYASVDYHISDENLDKYFDIAYEGLLKSNIESKNLRCAEIYLDIISNIDPEKYYENYHRDYTPEDILRVSEVIKEKLIPVSEKLREKYENGSGRNDKWADINFKDPFKTIEHYSSQLSENIKASADKLIDQELYRIGKGSNCYTGSYTVELAKNNSAMIYLYSDKTSYDLLTAVHEFGHFYSSFYDNANSYTAESNIDIAEAQSQGMELLFMQFYDDIFMENADAALRYELYNYSENIISSFLVGEFEYRALTQADELTPEGVIKLYNEILGDQAENYPFFYMTHLFEVPGYYISYGVSALAALDMLDEALNEPEKAVEMYEKLAQVAPNSPDTKFRKSLQEIGFSDVLTEEYITALAEQLSEI